MLGSQAIATPVAMIGQVRPSRRTGLDAAQARLPGHLQRDLADFLQLAPHYGLELARRPDLADSLRAASNGRTASGGAEWRRITDAISEASDLETGMRLARLSQQAAQFEIISHLVIGGGHRDAAAGAFSALADTVIAGMADLAEMQVRRRFGPLGGRWAICGLGKLGGQDMTATSDLDLMIIYDPEDVASQINMSRFAQALIHALEHRSADGRLYEADMRLRPNGDSGPIAVKLKAFDKYYRNDAWTWERMALSRLRPVCGDAALCEDIITLRNQALAVRSDDPDLTQDICDMRDKLRTHRAAKSRWDMKLTEGGLVDIEFVVQHALLTHAGQRPELISSNTRDALVALKQAGVFSEVEADALLAAESFQAELQQAQRATRFARASEIDRAPDAWWGWLCERLDVADRAACETVLAAHRRDVIAIRDARFADQAMARAV